MTDIEYIEKQFKEHRHFESSFKKDRTAFGIEYFHPKTNKRITWSEACRLIDFDVEKRAKRIIEKINPTNHDN